MASPVSHNQMITSNDTGTMITSDPTELMKTPGTRSPETGTGGRNPCWFDFTASFYGWNRLIPFHSQTYFLAVESIHVYPPPKKMVVSRPNTLCMLMLHHILLNNINRSLGTINH